METNNTSPLSAKTELNLQPLQEYFTKSVSVDEFLDELNELITNYVTAAAYPDSIDLETLGQDISRLATLRDHIKQIKVTKI